MSKHTLTSAEAVRAEFWRANPELAALRRKGKPQNSQHVDVRMAFVDWVDHAEREGIISERLASTVTL